MLIEAHMLTLEEFRTIANATKLANHGRAWNITYHEKQSAFSDMATAEAAIEDVHRALVNNALFMNQPEYRVSFPNVTPPPLHVLNHYPDIVARFPALGLTPGSQASLAL